MPIGSSTASSDSGSQSSIRGFVVTSDLPGEREGQALDAEPRPSCSVDGPSQVEVTGAREQLLQQHPNLEPGQGCANAGVNSPSE